MINIYINYSAFLVNHAVYLISIKANSLIDTSKKVGKFVKRWIWKLQNH